MTFLMAAQHLKRFEDYRAGESVVVGTYRITAKEMVAYARKWDPQPAHVDNDAARVTCFGGLIAAGSYRVAVAIRMVGAGTVNPDLVAAIGWDELRFPHPARPGDALTLKLDCIDKRPSASRQDRGIVRNRFTLVNQHGESVLTFQDIIIVRRRQAC